MPAHRKLHAKLHDASACKKALYEGPGGDEEAGNLKPGLKVFFKRLK